MSIEKLKSIIENSMNIVFFGGAGTSTESSIPDFRSGTGLYSIDNTDYRPETIFSHSFFMKHTDEFYKFYRSKMIFASAKPNPAHLALAELEKRGRLKAVITQNIDGLHQTAGSKNVLELHGSVHRNYCQVCGERYGLEYVISSDKTVPVCIKCNGIVKPDVVLYEEPLNNEVLEKSVYYVSMSDVLIVGGTSLVVYPAAGLINYYKGNKLVLINKSPTQYDNAANIVINDNIGKVLSSIL